MVYTLIAITTIPTLNQSGSNSKDPIYQLNRSVK